jgi:arsenate reductase-like glutaredoxin family protein
MDEKLSLNEIKESKIKDHLSLRKREYNKIINNKRKLFTDINNLFPNSTQGASSDNLLNNNNLFKTLSNQ